MVLVTLRNNARRGIRQFIEGKNGRKILWTTY
jgi:hypothetical protein